MNFMERATSRDSVGWDETSGDPLYHVIDEGGWEEMHPRLAPVLRRDHYLAESMRGAW